MTPEQADWSKTISRLRQLGIHARVIAPAGPLLLQVEGTLSDHEPFFLHCRGQRCWLGVGGDEPASAPLWHWMTRKGNAGSLSPKEASVALIDLSQRYKADRAAALRADTTWWNLRHRPRLPQSLERSTGGLALSWRRGTRKAIAAIEQQYGIKFPADYVAFMEASDGAEGEVGSRWLQLWDLEHIEQANRQREDEPAKVVFGSDGDGLRYAFLGPPLEGIYQLSGSGTKKAHRMGATLGEFLDSLIASEDS